MKLAIILIQEVLLFVLLIVTVISKDFHGMLLILTLISIMDIRRKLE